MRSSDAVLEGLTTPLRHAFVAMCAPTLTRPRETKGWWQYSVALETSVTLHHVFWNVSNRGGIVDALRDVVSCSQQDGDMDERVMSCLDELYQHIMDDDDPEDSELSD